jgi:hypothetical protein
VLAGEICAKSKRDRQQAARSVSARDDHMCTGPHMRSIAFWLAWLRALLPCCVAIFAPNIE